MAVSSGYGVTAPSALDPFPIETKLAELAAGNNPGNAANLLSQYHQQQVASEGNYNYNLDRQHEFAYQQLARQMADEHAKNLLKANERPGGISLLQNSARNQGLPFDISPELVTNLEQHQRDMQLAEQAQKGGAAAFSFTEAGAQPNTQQLAQLSGGLAGPQGTPLSTVNANIAANARLAAARIGAAATGLPSRNFVVEGPYGKENLSFSGKHATDANVDRFMKEHGQNRLYAEGGPPANRLLPPEAQALTPQGRAAAGAGSPPTSAPPAPSGQQMTVRPNNEMPGKKEFQTKVMSVIEGYKGNPAYAKIKEGMARNNGLPFVDNVGGQWVVVDPTTGRPF